MSIVKTTILSFEKVPPNNNVFRWESVQKMSLFHFKKITLYFMFVTFNRLFQLLSSHT